MSVRIEGLTPQELLALPDQDLRALVLTGSPVTFRAGSAEVLGQFELLGQRLVIELAHIDGGGEGVLPTIASLASRYAAKQSLAEVEWLVYATNCTKPNPKLRRVLERRGFEVRQIEGKGECYHRIETKIQVGSKHEWGAEKG